MALETKMDSTLNGWLYTPEYEFLTQLTLVLWISGGGGTTSEWTCSALQSYMPWKNRLVFLVLSLKLILPLNFCFSGLPDTMMLFQASDVPNVRWPPSPGLGSDLAGSCVSWRLCLPAAFLDSLFDMNSGEEEGNLLLMYILILGRVDFPLF